MSSTIQENHIAFFLNNLNGGGIQRSVINLAHDFVERGVKVEIVVTKLEGPFVKEIPAEAEVVDLGKPKLSKIPFKLAHYLKRNRPAVMLSNMHYNNELAILAKYISGAPTRVVVVDQNSLSPCQRPPISHPVSFLGLHPARANLLIRLFYRWADAVIATSQGVANDIVRISRLPYEKIQVIYNPIITPTLEKKAQQPLDHDWFAPGAPPLILGVGRLEPQKDFPTLIHAFAQVRQVIDARLMILGSGSQRSYLEALIQELHLENDVLLPGYVDNPYAYMAKASVFALSSAWEGFGNVVAEALAVGTPVVSTDCESGPAEILDHGKYGELVPVKDTQALAKGILKVLQEGGKEAPKEWLRQFTSAEVTEHYLQALG